MRKFYLLICLVIVQLVTYGQNRTFGLTNVKSSASRTISSLVAADGNDSGSSTGSIPNITTPTLVAAGLSKGDLAVIGMNGDSDTGTTIRSFAVVALNTIPANEVIFITDRGWINAYGSTPGHFVGAITTPRPSSTTTNEGILQWTPSVTIPAGTIIIFKIDLANRQVLGTKGDGSSLPSADFSILSDSWTNTNLVANPWPPAIGDQLIIYQGSESSPSFIFAFNNLKSNATNVSNGWNTNPNSIEPPTQLPIYSELPSDLGTTYSTAFLTPTTNSSYPNVKYNPSLSSGSKTTWLADITNTTKWESATASNPYNFSLGFGSTAMTQFQVGSLAVPVVTGNPPNRTICLGGNTTFPATVTNATSYQWQENSGSGFVDITNGGIYSNATTATLTITGATAGMSGYTYRLVATGTGGSATSNAATLTVINITATTSQTNVSCNGGSNGTATVVPAGGIAPYTYSWSPSGGTGATASGLAAGNYTVTITDNLLCQTTRNFTITQPTAITATTSQTNVSCNGGTNGTATVTPTGGTGGYTYSWSPSGGTAATATGLSPGSYTVTITDANACQITRTVTITQPTAITATTSQTNVSCNGGTNGTATVTPAGGTGAYTYSWSPSGGTGATATGLAPGTYTVTITDANACQITRTVTITQPTAITATTSQTNVSCNGGTNGTATVTPTGGTGGYTYSWSPSGGTAATATGLSPGSYTVTITDANACQITRTVTITQPTAITATTSQTNVSCNGGTNGTATVTPAGGTGAYTYSWSPSGGTGATATGLAPGTYTVTITDANSCQITRNFTITQPTAITATTSQTNVSCNGGTNGTATVTPAGGAGAYTYSWSPSGGTGATATGLAPGTYTVTITDANACQITRTVTITQPTAITATTSQTNVSCNGGTNGTATVTPTGGTGGYTYSWSPSGGTAATATGLAPGTYTVTITDANSCQITRNFTITQPTAITATTSQTNVSCNGGTNGTATVTPAGGAGAYTYSWSPSGGTGATATGLAPGTYTVTITDANACQITRTVTITQPTAITATTSQTNVSCNGGTNGTATVTPTGGTGGYTYSWSPSGGTAATATGLSPGSYTVTITDANACQITRTVTITQPATAVSGTTVVTNIACNGGSTGAINLTPAGGTSPYTFNWGGGITTEDRTGLAAGTYTVIITDANGCAATVNATVTQPATAVSGTTVVTNIACNGASNGAINLTPAGGAAPYTFNWSGGITTEDRTGLAAGTYTVIITDANGCTATVNATVTQPATAVSGTTVVTNIACNGASNGAINLTPAGGTAPYTFNWGGGITTEDRTGLAAGTYTVIITDANGCTATVNATVTQPATAVSGTTVVTNIACNGASNGAINLTPAGGTAPYTFNWGGGITTEDRTGLAAGTYTVIITDANGCAATVNATVTQPATAVSGTTVVTNIACNGASNGAINLTPAGGTAPYTFNWGGGITTEDRTGLAAGTYTVIITDANGCTATVNATVTQPATAVSGTTVVTNIACNGASNGAINLTPAGGTAPYTFNWGGGITTEDRTGLTAGTYTVIITDANGCTATVNATVTQPATAVSGTTVVTNIACNGASNGAINLTPAGGTAPYTFNWGGGITTEDRTGLTAGTYTVIITDANGCTATVSATVTQPATAVSGTTVVTNIACNGASNGAIDLTPAGGTAPYTFNWGGGITTEDRTGLTAGTYTVIITDANGCTATVNATVTQPIALTATVSQTNVSCNGGSNGTATITVSGGTAPYTYSWSPSGGTGAIATGLAAGTYTVTVTDANSCTITRTVTITQSSVVGAPTGAAVQSFNAGDTLSALVVNGQNIKWYASASNATNHANSLPLTTPIVNNTTYYATQTSGGCESTASLAVLAYNASLSVGNVTKDKSEMQIYPNPVSDILKISGEERISKFVISSLDGRKITEKILRDGERGINVSSLVQGTYLIQVFAKNQVKTFKFIKK